MLNNESPNKACIGPFDKLRDRKWDSSPRPSGSRAFFPGLSATVRAASTAARRCETAGQAGFGSFLLPPVPAPQVQASRVHARLIVELVVD